MKNIFGAIFYLSAIAIFLTCVYGFSCIGLDMTLTGILKFMVLLGVLLLIQGYTFKKHTQQP